VIQRIKNCIEKYDDILSWKIWENIKTKSNSFGSFQLWTSLIFTAVFYLPFLGHGIHKIGFLYFGDVIGLWVPQLFNSHLFNNEFIFKGVDFFTHGGASEYFLRPNILTYNPLILLLSYIIDADNLVRTLRFCFGLFVLHSFLACFFAQKLCARFLNFDKYLSLFTAVCFSFSLFFINNLGFVPFFFIGCLMPVCIYALLSCAKKFNITSVLLSSFLIVTIYTSGYLVLSVFVVGVSLIFCCFHFYINNQFKIRNILRILTPFIIASLITLPLYIAISDFHDIVMPHKKSLAAAAHVLGTNPNISLRFLSNALPFPGGEKQYIAIGLIPISILLIFIFSYSSNKNKIEDQNNKLAIFGFGLFLIVFFACLGIYSPFSYFMYKTPIIGQTHLYTRYLIPLTLLLFITLAILLNFITKQRDESVLKKLLFLILLSFLILSSFSYLEKPLKGLTGGYFIFELMLAITFISCLLLIKNNRVIVVISTILIFSSSLMWFYKLSFGNLSNRNNEIIHELVHKNYHNENKLVSYFKNNSEREIVKIADITPNFKENYFMKNMPWLLRGKINISSYYGYEVHLARDIKYHQKSPYMRLDNNFVFTPNIEWLKKTGAEFIIFERGFEKKNEELLKLVDDKTILELPHNTVVARLKFQEPVNTISNNGYVRILSEDRSVNVTNFNTNNANYIAFDTDSKEPLSAQYLFWPNKHMKPYVNGKKFEFERVEDLDVLNIPAGKNKVEIIYKNTVLDIFLVLYFGFLAVFAIFILWRIALLGTRIKNKLIKS
jgi:hypothetical protein